MLQTFSANGVELNPLLILNQQYKVYHQNGSKLPNNMHHNEK